MTADQWSLVFSMVAMMAGAIAGVIATAALSMVIGLKNSTHQVVWKPLEPEAAVSEIFNEDEPEIVPLSVNPNKKFKNEIPVEEEPFNDPSDPFETSNKF